MTSLSSRGDVDITFQRRRKNYKMVNNFNIDCLSVKWYMLITYEDCKMLVKFKLTQAHIVFIYGRF